MAAKPSRKGVQDIRTVAGRSTSPGSTHKRYLRLCTLEMERSRREQERRVAQERADVAKSRVDQLESEIFEILQTIETPSVSAVHAEAIDTTADHVTHSYGARAPRKEATS